MANIRKQFAAVVEQNEANLVKARKRFVARFTKLLKETYGDNCIVPANFVQVIEDAEKKIVRELDALFAGGSPNGHTAD